MLLIGRRVVVDRRRDVVDRRRVVVDRRRVVVDRRRVVVDRRRVVVDQRWVGLVSWEERRSEVGWNIVAGTESPRICLRA